MCGVGGVSTGDSSVVISVLICRRVIFVGGESYDRQNNNIFLEVRLKSFGWRPAFHAAHSAITGVEDFPRRHPDSLTCNQLGEFKEGGQLSRKPNCRVETRRPTYQVAR